MTNRATCLIVSPARPTRGDDKPGRPRRARTSSPEALRRETRQSLEMLKPGCRFLDFELEEELGRGAFGRVFLARQGELAGRRVVLKIAPDLMSEPLTLAQLQHANIVPIYSVHQSYPFQAICMPFFGPVTLEHILMHLRSLGTMPRSGLALVHSLTVARGSPANGPETVETPVTALVPDGDAIAPAAGSGPVVRSIGKPARLPNRGILSRLCQLSYVEAVLWIGSRLAEGLAHAHDRGILHRDLKPANVLITDDGQPMLLDFNLAGCPLAGGASGSDLNGQMGGTLPYMAPEHLEAFRVSLRSVDDRLAAALAAGAEESPVEADPRPRPLVDERSDIYSLGLILGELLTGSTVYPSGSGPMEQAVPVMIRQRLAPPPSLRAINSAISPAAESIIHKAIDPDPERRYRSAADLSEDIKRHLARQPLEHAPERSPRERFAKWARRNPAWAYSGAGVASAAAVTFALAVALGWRW